MVGEANLKRTPLYGTHVGLGGRMVPFGGWEMPVQYTSILDEARAVRMKAGLFDVSHMGRVTIEGAGAATLLSRVFSSSPTAVKVGRGRYGVICTPEGGILDDCILYRRAEQRFLLVPNASNADPVVEWLRRWGSGVSDARIAVITPSLAMVALQGPVAASMLQGLTSADLSTLRTFSFVEEKDKGADSIVARTGYTGEDGFELMVPSGNVAGVWKVLMERGATPCGLGARDVLRLEAGLPLHGNDIGLTTNPYEAGLERFVDPDREGYVAGTGLRQIRDTGPSRKLVGFKLLGRSGITRHGYPIMDGSKPIGEVTSGGYSPTLDMNIGMGYVPKSYAAPGTRFAVDVRGRLAEAEVAPLPFYHRRRDP
ncbi:MAG: glycine cleavage system aminomethyltransferase GcvT [SAR202 cluster bacterium]|nr:glycine cleavage system aminomethyltransferase GcvT [SAR202 cluster bacterium]